MNYADGIILLIVAGLVAAVVRVMRNQKKSGSGCHSCAGCSKANTCSTKDR